MYATLLQYYRLCYMAVFLISGAGEPGGGRGERISHLIRVIKIP